MAQQSILITGCSSGIGYAAAKILKERGYRVFATTRKPADVTRLLYEGFEALPLDLDDSMSIYQAVNVVLSRTGGTLDALFNNSGYLQAGGTSDLTREMIRNQFETNVFGPMELTRLILPVMQQQGHGRIIQNSSILGVICMPYYGAYNASKYALEGFSNTLRQECRGTGIHVSIINPGPIISDLRKSAYQRYEKTLDKEKSSYQSIYAQMEESYFKPSEKDKKIALGPEAVVNALIHALENKNPRAHYFIGAPAKTLALLRRLLPDNAFDWLITKISYKKRN